MAQGKVKNIQLMKSVKRVGPKIKTYKNEEPAG
jgi:hypothetical protein